MKLLELIKNEINQALNVKEIGIKNEYTLFFNVGSFYGEVRNISHLLILDISSEFEEIFEKEEISEIDNYIEYLNEIFIKRKEKTSIVALTS